MQPDADSASAASDAAQPHVIVSLRLDFQMPDRGMARAVQEKLSQVVHHQLLTEAEPVFSEACAPGSTRRLDRLVVISACCGLRRWRRTSSNALSRG